MLGGLLRLAVFIGFLCVWGASGAQAVEPRPIMLKTVAVKEFSALSPLPPLVPFVGQAALKDDGFSLESAANYRDLSALVGGLTPRQERFLEANRFLLLPKPVFSLAEPEDQAPVDEMLSNFDGLGGSVDPARRSAVNARLIGPDIFLHAWHQYLSTRLEAAEAGPLYDSVRIMLSRLYDHAAVLRQSAPPAGVAGWERLMAQLVVPLVLINNCGENSFNSGAESAVADTLEKALVWFDGYRQHFSPAMAKSIQAELARIYQAETVAEGLLGLIPVTNPGAMIDYAVFTPKGRQAGRSRSRAYYRTMVWLSHLGWNIRSEQGAADALNFALTMSYETPEAMAGSVDPSTAWARVMTINSFFLGSPIGPSYQELAPFLMKEAGVPEFSTATSADPEALTQLVESADTLVGPLPLFGGLDQTVLMGVVSVFPLRVTWPEMIAKQLSAQKEATTDLPVGFSALGFPLVLGHKLAQGFVPKQAALMMAQRLGPDGDRLQVALNIEALNRESASLAANLAAMPEAGWLKSASSSRLRLLSTLVGSYGDGYPLYMRGAAFPVKQMETILGAITELIHEAPYPVSTPNQVAVEVPPPVDEDAPPAPVVKGFVEPNMAFWMELGRQVQQVMGGFKELGLFPEDQGEYGALRRFSKRIERCASLAEQELAGVKLSEDDYEFIRLFTLDWMAAPPGNQSGVLTEAQRRSGLVARLPAAAMEPPDRQVMETYEATAEPWLLLVLVGNEKSPRLVIGLAFNHYEFMAPSGPRLTDDIWQLAAYANYRDHYTQPGPRLPTKNFWYEALQP